MARSAKTRHQIADVHYRVDVAAAGRHVYRVKLCVAHPAPLQVVSLPAWIPGSYLIRDFARHLNQLDARQDAPCALEQRDKSTWAIHTDPKQALVLRYEVYALDPLVRAAWLDEQRGFFNGASLLLRVHGQETRPHDLTFARPECLPGWQLATSMTPVEIDEHGFGTYRAADYDELLDHPAELGRFWSGRFEALGSGHRVVVAGATAAFDGPRLLRDIQAICETQIRFWRGCTRDLNGGYVFLLNATASGYGGIEHRASCALMCARADLPRVDIAFTAKADEERYQALLGVISHEYFHSWNVKRLKPAVFEHYDYTRENYTDLLWFFEGFTSYYDDLLLLRAGLIDEGAYFKRLTKCINQVLQAPGRRVQSAAQASFDAWTRLYRADENTPNNTISYYSKGALIALCLDLTLRHEGQATLDDVMRALWQRCHGGAMTESDIAAAISRCGGRSFAAELQAWVHGTEELPIEPLLGMHAVGAERDVAPLAQALGLRIRDDSGVILKVVLADSPAAMAGMAPGDEWLGVEVRGEANADPQETSSWRLSRLDDLPVFIGNARQVTALVARDQRMLRLRLDLPGPVTTWRLVRKKKPVGATTWPAS